MKKRTVIWLLIVVAVLAAAYAVLHNWKAISEKLFPQEIGEYSGDGTTEIYNFGSSEAIQRIDWTLDGKEYSLRLDGEDFVCDDDVSLDQDKINKELLQNIYSVKASHVLEGAALADYGLDEPWAQMTVYGGGEEEEDPDKPKVTVSSSEPDWESLPQETLYFGTYNTVTGTYYATQDFKTVYLLYNKVTTHLGSYELYSVTETAPESGTATYIAVTKDGVTTEFFPAEDGDGTFYSNVFTWYTVLDGGAKQPVNLDSLDLLYQLFTELEWASTVESKPQDLAPYGLDDPIRLDISYSYQDTNAEGEADEVREDSFTLLLGAEAEDGSYYAMQEGTNIVHTIAADKAEPLLNFDAESMQMHVAVVPEWQTLKSMELTFADGTTCFCEIRKDADGNAAYFIDGTEVEKEDVRSVFTSLFNPDIDGIATDSHLSADDAVLTVRFLRDRTTFADMTLSVIPYSSSLYVLDFAGEQRYLVTQRVVDGVRAAVAEAQGKVS